MGKERRESEPTFGERGGEGAWNNSLREKHFSNLEGEIFEGWVYLELTHY